MTLVGALAIGLLIGISLGTLGAGGSILTVPALVYLLGEPATTATTSSLVIVGITAAAGVIGHARAGRVRWSAGAVFGAVGVAASFAGTALNRTVDPNVLLLAFGALMLVAAAAMLRRATVRATPQLVAVHAGESAPPTVDHPATGPPAPVAHAALRVVAVGLVVGFLTGFLGVGGGFVVVPALTVVLGYDMPIAVGTSLLVVALNSVTALVARTGHDTFHWAIIVPFTLAAIVGSLVGRDATHRVPGEVLTRWFAGLLIAVAVYVSVKSASGTW